MTKFDRLVRAYATTILKFRFVVLALALGLLGVSGYGLSKLDFDTTFRIWHPPESEQLHTYDQRVAKFGGDDTMIVLFKDGKGVLNNRVLSAIRGLTDDIWRIPSVKRVDSLANFQIIRGSRIDHESPALAVTKKHIVAAGDKNDLIAWERPSFTPHALVGHEGLVESVVVSPDGARAYSGSEDRTVRVWDLSTYQTVAVLRRLPESVSALTLSPDGKRLYVGSYKTVLVWDTSTLELVGRLEGHDDYVTKILASADGQRVYVASREIHAYNADNLQRLAVWPGHADFITALAGTKDGTKVISAGSDGRVLAWDPAAGTSTTLMSVPKLEAMSLAILPKEDLVVVGLSDGTVRGLDFKGGAPKIAHVHNDWVLDLAVTPDGRVYSSSRDRNVAMHVPGQGPRALTLQAHRGSVRRLALDPDDYLISMGDDGDVYVWAPKTYEMVARLYRSQESPLPPPTEFKGPKLGHVNLVNGFRYPVEFHVAGVSYGAVLGNAALDVTGLPLPEPKECNDDAACGSGQYCDVEAETPVCTGRTIVEAFVPGTKTRLWAGETFLKPNDVVTVRAPSDEPFSVAASAEAPLDERARVGAFLTAFAADKALLGPALEATMGKDAQDPQSFITPHDADQLAESLKQKGAASAEVLQFLSTHAQAKTSAYKLPVQPFRLREVGYYLLRGPVSPAQGLVINATKDATAVFANVQTLEGDNPLAQAVKVRRDLEAIVKSTSAKTGITFHLAGDAIQDTTFEEYAQRDIKTLFPLFVGAVVIILLFWYRQVAGVLIPVGLVMLAVANTMGISSLLGAKLNNMTVAVPQVVLACCVGDLNHVFNGYLDHLRHGESKQEAIINTMVFEFVPCFWTASTTALGFFAMIYGTTILPIATFGWMGGIGAMAAWLGTFTVMPCILSLLPTPKAVHQKHEEKPNSFAARMDARLVRLNRYVNRTSGAIIFMAAVVTGIAVYGLTKVSFDTNSIEMFAEDAPFRVASRFAEDNIAGPFGITVLVDTGQKGGIRQTKYLESMAKLKEKLESDPDVTSAVDLSDIMKSMNRVMNQDMEENYRVPDSDARASSYYNAYTFSLPAGQELTNRVSADESSALIDARLRNHAAGWIINWGTDLKAWAEKNTPDLKVSITAKSWLYSHMLTSMSQNFFQDVGQAVVSISITLFILARNIRLGILAMIVNLLPLFITVGFTSLIGKTLDISILISCSVAMGIVVDDTIHYIAKYKRLREQDDMTHEQASEFLAQEHSKASIATTLVLVGGFLMFVFTDYQINRNFGLTTAVMLTIGAAFDLLILPASLKIWGGKATKQGKRKLDPSEVPIEKVAGS